MIRKISIGIDYKNAMHYSLGQYFGDNTIENIRQIDPQHFEIWIRTKDNEVLLWKSIINAPVVVEQDIKAFG